FDITRGLLYVLGADALGRPLLARVFVAAQNTILVAAAAVFASSFVGTALVLVAGYSRSSAAQWMKMIEFERTPLARA
ncbi:hypothetical protein ACC756_39210, partial [Rhizobium ruizarguesonis]